MKGTTKISERRDEAIRLREAGLTYEQIGQRWGISKQRVWKIVKGNAPRRKGNLDSKIMLTTSDVARLLGIHVNTVRRWSNQGIIKSYHIGSRGDRRFQRQDVDRFLKEGEIE